MGRFGWTMANCFCWLITKAIALLSTSHETLSVEVPATTTLVARLEDNLNPAAMSLRGPFASARDAVLEHAVMLRIELARHEDCCTAALPERPGGGCDYGVLTPS
jgi:hypothetical protein